EQLDAALATSPAYVALGPIFETRTKVNPDPVVGVEVLRAASARAASAGVPLVAIGGITRERARELVGLVDAVAVVADLLPSRTGPDALREVTARAHDLHDRFVPAPVLAGAAR
ncbi:MAG TPA: thiamine phosphate synthase, partial [Polyangiaceae bacterium]|nr:thiamine phosphate synthase [Polyangiaceae bacterium]